MRRNILMHISLLFIILGMHSCKENTFEGSNGLKSGIYFSNDSIKYSFGVTPLEIKEHVIEVPVRIMGVKANVDREFEIQISDPGTAVAGTHYSIPETITVVADSINTVVPITVYREALGETEFRISLKLIENENFTPVNESLKDAVVYFNNNVDRPNWKNWRGVLVWPTQLGVGKGDLGWNPIVYIKFIELFRKMEETVPDRYNAIVAIHGEDLAVINNGWPFDFNQSLTKYVLIPLYQYYMEQNPQLGEVIPRPSGY